MTEDQWLCCTSALRMLEYLRGKGSDRKLRLFACACCRRAWGRLPDPRNRDLVAAVEDHPDGTFDDPDLQAAITGSSAREWEFGDEPAYWAAKYLGRGFYEMTAAGSALVVALQVAVLADLAEGGRGREAEGEVQAALLRCVFGPLPFRAVRVEPEWLSWSDGLVVRLARAADVERQMPTGTLDNARLAVLADALEEAGCTDDEVLRHLRQQGGVHVRGCWVLDLLLNEG